MKCEICTDYIRPEKTEEILRISEKNYMFCKYLFCYNVYNNGEVSPYSIVQTIHTAEKRDI